MKKLLFLIGLFIFTSPVWATDYAYYFATGGSGSTCSEELPCDPTYAQTKLDAFSSSGNTLTLYFNRGDTWTLTSTGPAIDIDKSNVTVDAYGTGDLPIIDGQGIYPSTSSQNVYMISIGEGSGSNISNIYIKNIKIYNTHNTVSTDPGGGGIIFAGTSGGGYFTDTGSVENCEFEQLGWAAINIYRVPNSGGTSTAIKIENNFIDGVCWYPENAGVNGPQAINSNDGYSYGHEARYNVINLAHNEGIGAGGFSVVEYNSISDSDNPSIYFDPRSSSVNTTTDIRYNLIGMIARNPYF
jgi:hypothetical protein